MSAQAAGSAPTYDTALLLQCCSVLARLHGVPVSVAALREELPDPSALAIESELGMRALEVSGFRCATLYQVVPNLSASLCPMLLHFADGSTCVLAEIEGVQARIVEGISSQSRTLSLRELEGKGVAAATLAAPPVVSDDNNPLVPEVEQKRWFWSNVWRYRGAFTEAILLTFVANVLALSMTILTMSVYDRVLPNQAYATLWALSIGAVIAITFEFFIRGWRARVLDKVGKRLDITLGSLIFRHVMGARIETHMGQSSGAFSHVIREYESVRDFVTSLTLTVVADVPFAILFVVVIAYIAGPIAWVPAGAMLVLATFLLAVQVPLASLLNAQLRQGATRSGLVVEALASLDTLKSLRAERIVARQHDRLADELADIGLRSRWIAVNVTNLSSTIQQLATVAMLAWGVHQVGDGATTAGALVGAVMLLGRALQPISGLTALATRYQQAKHALHSLNNIMLRPLERDPKRPYFHRQDWKGTLHLRNTSFSYHPKIPEAIREVSFEIQPGERVGVIGRMGSGKSTLLRLMSGMLQPTSGDIGLDGIDLHHVDIADIRATLRMLNQDCRLMQGTIFENLLLASPHATDEEIIQAAQATGVLAFAKEHPMGLHMPVGEGGRMLSGGQRQAVALAQLMLSDARVVLLDEPTAAMDQASEQVICNALARLSLGRTLVIVTHKASLLAMVDRLIVLEGGRLYLDGPKDEVMQALANKGARLPGVAAAPLQGSHQREAA
jgi:ATP-binding cassette subfamily C protein LapB